MTITLFIIIATCLISFLCFNNEDSKMKLIFHPYTIYKDKSQWMRFISGGFIHADFLHLGFNMYALYGFGEVLECSFFPMVFGNYYKLAYILFYLSAIAFSDVYTYFKHKNNSSYYSLGASGAVSAVVFACILFAPNLLIMGMPGWLYGLIYLGFSSYASKRNLGNIAHDAHIWGAIYGLLLPLIFKPTLYFDFINNILN
jgi:membrane associated rhomboid family serine protease